MGNHVAMGHAVNCFQDAAGYLGCSHESLKFEGAAKAVMNLHGIESWNAKSLVKENLRRQSELAHQSPLRNISVQDGLRYIKQNLKKGLLHRFSELAIGAGGVHIAREDFVTVCWDMLHDVKDYQGRRLAPKPKDREDLYDIFDSMDFDRSGELSTGEWAGGCSVFFRGTTQECVEAVFEVLDQDNSKTLTNSELREYLKPFLKAMMPESAAALQPMLLKRATENIFKEMDKDANHTISAGEMLAWTQSGHNIIDSLADLIDREVYALWMENNKENARRNPNAFYNQQQNYPNNMNGPGYGGPGGPPGYGPPGACGGQPGTYPNGQMQGYGAPGQYGGPQGMYPNGQQQWGQPGSSPCGSQGWGQQPVSPHGSQGSPGGFGSPGQQGGYGPMGNQQVGGYGQGPPVGSQGNLNQPPLHTQPYDGAGDRPQYGAAPAPGSVSQRGSVDHFASAKHHWQNVPPPPPPPARTGGALASQGAINAPAYAGFGGYGR